MTEEQQAQLLADWLASKPGSPPPPELDPDVVEAVACLAPQFAPAPRVTADDILSQVTSGPLAMPSSIAASPKDAPAADSSENRIPWTRLLTGLGTIAAAAIALLAVIPTLNESQPALSPMDNAEQLEAKTRAPAKMDAVAAADDTGSPEGAPAAAKPSTPSGGRAQAKSKPVPAAPSKPAPPPAPAPPAAEMIPEVAAVADADVPMDDLEDNELPEEEALEEADMDNASADAYTDNSGLNFADQGLMDDRDADIIPPPEPAPSPRSRSEDASPPQQSEAYGAPPPPIALDEMAEEKLEYNAKSKSTSSKEIAESTSRLRGMSQPPSMDSDLQGLLAQAAAGNAVRPLLKQVDSELRQSPQRSRAIQLHWVKGELHQRLGQTNQAESAYRDALALKNSTD